MPDPITPALIIANCAWAIVGNRADAAAVGSMKRLANLLRRQETPANHDILMATHRAFVKSVQLTAAVCEQSAGDARAHFVARRLTEIVESPELTTMKSDATAIPKKELDASVRALFEGAHAEPARNATEAVIGGLERAMGESLTDEFRTIFRNGTDRHRSWPQAFELFFAEQVKTNERVFRALNFERLNEIIAFAEAHAGELAEILGVINHGFAEGVERDARMEGKLDALLEEVRAQRGAQIDKAGIDPAAVFKIARKVAENVAEPDQALAEIDRAIDDLLALRDAASLPGNLDSLVDDALRRINERASVGEFDAAAHEAARAFAAWEDRETERRDRECAIGIRFAEENIRANRLRRDAGAVADWIVCKARLEHPSAEDLLAAAEQDFDSLIESGRDRGVNFDLEIAAALAVDLQRSSSSGDRAAQALLWRGIAVALLGERQEESVLLREAVAIYRDVLEVFTRDRLPLEWAMAQNNLAASLQAIGERQEGTAAINEAVDAYRAVFDVYTREQLPLDWAMAKNNLGNALGILGKRLQGTAALEESVICYRDALEIYSFTQSPLDWAMTQNNLGNSLRSIGERQDGTAALEEAVVAFRAALEVYTLDQQPVAWAMTQNNLGNALGTLGKRQSGVVAIGEAVVAFRAALQVRTRDRLPLQWAMTQNNLGNALATLGQRQEETASLEEAVVAYRAALEVRTRDRFPYQWAMTQYNLGNVLRNLGSLQDGTVALDESITAYQAALQIYTRDQIPLNWALTQDSYGRTLGLKAEELEDCQIAREAVAAINAALEVFADPTLAWYRAGAEQSQAWAKGLSERLCQGVPD